MKLLDTYVLLEVVKNDEKKLGNTTLYIPTEMNTEETPRATVAFVAPDVKRAKVGDVVLYNHLFDEIMVDGKRYLKGKEDGIYAILEST